MRSEDSWGMVSVKGHSITRALGIKKYGGWHAVPTRAHMRLLSSCLKTTCFCRRAKVWYLSAGQSIICLVFWLYLENQHRDEIWAA